MTDFVAERADRLHAICGGLDNVTTRLPLLIEQQLPGDVFNILKNYINVYLYDSLTQIYGSHYRLGNDLLETYPKNIADLPNITPNGLLLPKRHSLLSYNLVLRQVVNLVKGFGLRGASHLHFPVNIRVIDGTPNPAVDGRPRSSTKLHSDVWAGEFTNHVMILMPIAGDMDRNGIDLYEPGPSFFPDFVRTIADFNEGAGLTADATRYDVVMRPGHVYFLDAYLLHRTRKGTPGLRLAVNFAFLTEQRVPSDLPIETARHDEYVPAADWYRYGSELLATTTSVARRFTAEEMNQVRNYYAERYGAVPY